MRIELVAQGKLYSSRIVDAGTVVTTKQDFFDESGRPWQSVDENGRVMQQLFDRWGQTIETRSMSTTENGQVVWLVSRSVFDSFGRLILSTDPYVTPLSVALGEGISPSVAGSATEYDSLGRTTVTRRVADTTVRIDIVNGALLSSVVNKGTMISEARTIYTNIGRIERTINEQGQVRDNEYDDQNRLIAEIGPRMKAEEVGLADRYAGKIVRLRTENERDAYDRKTAIWTSILQVEREDGTIETIDRTLATRTSFRSDAEGRVVQTTHANGTSTRNEYNVSGQLIAETDQRGNRRTMQYDSLGRLTAVNLPKVTTPDGRSLAPEFHYSFDAAGNQTAVEDSLGRTTRFTYDSAGHMLTRTLPDGLVESFSYDDRGRETVHVSFEGTVTEKIYDDGTRFLALNDPNYRPGSGMLIEERFYRSLTDYRAGQQNSVESWRYQFDAFDRKVRAQLWTRPNASAGLTLSREESWIYDAYGRMIQEAKPEGVINYAYDANTGSMVRMWTTRNSGLNSANLADAIDDTRYVWNSQGQLSNVRVVELNDAPLPLNRQQVTTYRYDIQGRLIRTELPNGVIEAIEYDSVDNATRLTHTTSTNVPLGEFKYTYNAKNQKTRLVETFWRTPTSGNGSDNDRQTTVYDWVYDSNDRLIQESIDSFDNTLDRRETYTHDLFGNRVQAVIDLLSTPAAVDQAIAYLFDQNDRLISEQHDDKGDGTIDQSITYTWNATQLAAKTTRRPSSLAPTSIENYTYDLQGRQTTVATVGSSTEQVVFKYAADGQRVSRSVTDAMGKVVRTEYLNAGLNPTKETQTIVERTLDAGGQRLKEISYTIGLDEISQSSIVYEAASAQAAKSLYFVHDGHRSVRAMLDAAQVIDQRYTYSAYGELLIAHDRTGARVDTLQPGRLSTSLLYSGEYTDAQTGQQYLRARWYTPTVGRFQTLDPYRGDILKPLSLNKYSYTSGDPIQHVDPTGMSENLQSLGTATSIQSTISALGKKALGILARVSLAATVLELSTRADGNSKPLAKLTPEQRYSALKYANLAVGAYEKAESDGTFDKLDILHWYPEHYYVQLSIGYRSIVFRHRITNERVLAYAGTDDVKDIAIDLWQGVLGGSSQYSRAVSDAAEAGQRFGRINQFTGHSLGGGLASLAALKYEIHATTFNAAGLHTFTGLIHRVDFDAGERLIDVYRVQGDFLSTLQDGELRILALSLFVGSYGLLVSGLTGLIAPDGIGKTYWLPPSSMSMWNRHSMASDVIPALLRAV